MRVIWPAALNTSRWFKSSITSGLSLPAWHLAHHPMGFQFTADFHSKPGVRRRMKNFRIYSLVDVLPIGSPSWHNSRSLIFLWGLCCWVWGGHCSRGTLAASWRLKAATCSWLEGSVWKPAQTLFWASNKLQIIQKSQMLGFCGYLSFEWKPLEGGVACLT